MVSAVITAIIALLIAAGVVAAFFVWRSRRGDITTRSRRSSRETVRSIDSVGISSMNGSNDAVTRANVRVGSSDSASGRISEAVRPRFVALGVLAAAIFGSLGAKLWSMQVLAADQYRSRAQRNKYTDVATPAPRGYIYDTDGVALVTNRSTLTVLAEASVADDRDVVQRLSAVLGIPYNVVRMRIKDQSSGAQSQRVVCADARLRDVAFISEHSDAFTGVTIQERTVRTYPYGALAAHVLGYTGSISAEELEAMPDNRTIELGDVVGKSGIEAYYDNILAGEHGIRRVVADSQGRVVEVESETPAEKGSDIYLTLIAPVQYVADWHLAALIAPGGVIGEGQGVGGAVVALDAIDGSILAMASYPTFAPETFTGGISNEVWNLYSTEESYYPLLNRAISGTYPAASTYKAFTSLAGLKYGFADEKKEWDCEGSWDGFHSNDIQNCWDLSGHGDLNLYEGIIVSCDVVFYEIAKDFFYAGVTQGGTISDTALQEEIALFGFGKSTGIDLSGEEVGRIPTPEWKAQHWSDVPTEGVWRGGDLTNLVIGQGDVLVTPLQLAVGYGGVATGKIVKPHLFKEVRNKPDTPVITFTPEVVSEPKVERKNYELVRSALKEVAKQSDPIVNIFDEHGIDMNDIGSKTGTGEVAGKRDVAWFVCYYPADKPRYVVATCIEQGGGGARIAGPVGAEVMCALIDYENGELEYVGQVAASTGKSVPFPVQNQNRTD